MLRLVVLSSCGAFDRFIIDALAAEHEIVRVLRVDWTNDARKKRRHRKQHPIDALSRALERRLYFTRYFARMENSLDAALGFPLMPDTPLSWVDALQVNASETRSLLHQSDADLLITSAAPILCPGVFEIPRRGAWNVHRGIAPVFRGEHCLFWALNQREPGGLGVTIHRLDRGIDTGPIVAQRWLTLDPGDDEVRLLAKAARGAVEVLLPSLRALERARCTLNLLTDATLSNESAKRREGFAKASPRGALYREADRRLWSDLCCRVRRRLHPLPRTSGRIALPSGARTDWFETRLQTTFPAKMMSATEDWISVCAVDE